MGDIETVREALMLKVLDGLLESNDMPLACEVPLYGSRGTFGGPVFQLSMLRRVSYPLAIWLAGVELILSL